MLVNNVPLTRSVSLLIITRITALMARTLSASALMIIRDCSKLDASLARVTDKPIPLTVHAHAWMGIPKTPRLVPALMVALQILLIARTRQQILIAMLMLLANGTLLVLIIRNASARTALQTLTPLLALS